MTTLKLKINFSNCWKSKKNNWKIYFIFYQSCCSILTCFSIKICKAKNI